MKAARPMVKAGSRKCHAMTHANWIRDKTTGSMAQPPLIAPQPSPPKAGIMTLRPQERSKGITDGRGFHDDSWLRNRLIRAWILILASTARLASSRAWATREAWATRSRAAPPIG